MGSTTGDEIEPVEFFKDLDLSDSPFFEGHFEETESDYKSYILYIDKKRLNAASRVVRNRVKKSVQKLRDTCRSRGIRSEVEIYSDDLITTVKFFL